MRSPIARAAGSTSFNVNSAVAAFSRIDQHGDARCFRQKLT